jgi:D-alanine-D-alanine ligase
MTKTVVILQGGFSEEREISLKSSAAIAKALAEFGYQTIPLDPMDFLADTPYYDQLIGILDRGNFFEYSEVLTTPSFIQAISGAYLRLGEKLKELAPYIVFIGLHGGSGENGAVQSFLSLLNIPYTGSDMKASALCMDKQLSFILASSLGALIPDYLVLERETPDETETDLLISNNLDNIEKQIGFPLVVKPNSSGSSVGITLIRDKIRAKGEQELNSESADYRAALVTALKAAFRYSNRVIVQKYISGSELTVSILGETALPVVEIKVKDGWYDYRSKYTKGMTIYDVPASLSREETSTIQAESVKLYKAFGCSGYARVDFRYDKQDFYFLEINTLPGMTSLSLTPMAAKEAGLSFPELLDKIISFSLLRLK